jgi:RNA polymerase sigma factor (sigma-70 family)
MSRARASPASRFIHEMTGTLDTQNVADRELLTRFVAEKDEAAFANLVRRHGRMVLGVCLRVLRHQEDAEDAFQATFLTLFRKAPTFRPRESIGGWLYSVAYRVAQKTRIAAARRRKHEAKVVDQPAADQIDRLTVREASEILDEELVRLPDKFRIPLILCCLEGLSRDEAAERLGWQAGLLKSRLEQARERLAARLAIRGLTLPSALVALLFSREAAAAAVAPELIESTVGIANAFVAGTATSAVSARVIALSEGARSMFATYLKITTAILFGSAAIGLWATASLGLPATDPPGLGKGMTPARTPAEDQKPKATADPQVDLAKIDRTILKEPAYKTKNPKYCLLVFGPEAKTRVWLVHDGDTLYVDRNGNGDLTEEGEKIESKEELIKLEDAGSNSQNRREGIANDTLLLRVHFNAGTIEEGDGKTKHTLWVNAHIRDDEGYLIATEVDGKYLQMTDQVLQFADKPKDAPIVHINGPLVLRRFPPWREERRTILTRGDPDNQIVAIIWTLGIGKYSEAFLNPFKGIPEDVHPIANIEFQNKEPEGKPIRVRLPLDKRYVGNSLFYAPVKVPDEAADGKAKVTVNFADWKDRCVAPATFEVMVETPKKDMKP